MELYIYIFLLNLENKEALYSGCICKYWEVKIGQYGKRKGSVDLVIKRAVYMIAKKKNHVHYFDELSYNFIKYCAF